MRATRSRSAEVAPLIWAATATLCLLASIRHPAFTCLYRRTMGRPSRDAHCARAVSVKSSGIKARNSSSTSFSRSAIFWFAPTMGSSDARRNARQHPSSSSGDHFGCLPIFYVRGATGGVVLDRSMTAGGMGG
ncbi:hypothetical protein I4F81_000776 [Pyropia yezoensis]|uniref:Uncharacterized protein n=1 Tax=Pyropia yezoensis TaxID=2788 RepID=A0ACC3BJN4_PYRYE|nr:hypothetical protein I4F81_000776 [Neopyropia yezoensis]